MTFRGGGGKLNSMKPCALPTVALVAALLSTSCAIRGASDDDDAGADDDDATAGPCSAALTSIAEEEPNDGHDEAQRISDVDGDLAIVGTIEHCGSDDADYVNDVFRLDIGCLPGDLEVDGDLQWDGSARDLDFAVYDAAGEVNFLEGLDEGTDSPESGFGEIPDPVAFVEISCWEGEPTSYTFRLTFPD